VFIITLHALGWLAFLVYTILVGTWLRRNPCKRNAERTSRILHFLFWAGVAPPMGLGVFYPGLSHYDEIMGLPSLPRHSILLVVGSLAALVGVYLIVVSNAALMFSGKGTHAFWLTKRLVTTSVYKRTQNPMSLGFYLELVGIGLLVKSTTLTFGTLFIMIPIHVFYLKFFEAYELGLRLGQLYQEYRLKVPFLLPRCIFCKH